jgi:hypothetical protein
VADILHSWPEYWDDTLQTWVPIDPTWGNTTGGIDYFNKLDLNHIVFAYHGASSTTPYPAGSYKLGANPEKDVFVGLSTLPGKSTPTINLALKENPRVSFKNLAFTATVKNNGPTALYQQTLALSADDEPVSQTSYVVIPPFAVEEVVFKTDSGLFARNAPDTIKATIAGEEVMLKTNKETAAIVQFTIMLLFIFLLAAGTFLSVYKRKK